MLPDIIEKILNDFVNKQLDAYGNSIEKIILYGSYARGDYTKDSDVDIMVLTSIKDKDTVSRQLNAMYDSVYDYQLDLGVEVNPNMQNIDFYNSWLGKYPYYDNISKDGVVLYERLQ